MGQFLVNPYSFTYPPLDTYTGAAAAYSLRKLRTAYTGSAIRVRRSHDNTESDIGFDTDGNLNESGLLDFIGYQNLVRNSEAFNDATWTKTNSVVVADQTTDPLGGNTADFVRQNSGTDGVISTGNNVAFTSGVTYTASIYAKKEDYKYLLIALSGAAFPSSNRIGLFDLDAGTVASASQSGINATITPVGNGWYRCSITQTATSTFTTSVAYAPRPLDVLASTGNGTDGIYMWGAQVNVGSSPAKYQQTGSTAWTSLNGFVTTWYDQSGNARNATQTTQANQPRIVNAGTIDKEGGKPAIFFDGSAYQFDVSNSANIFRNVGYAHAFSVNSSGTTANENRWIFLASIGTSPASRALMGKFSTANGVVIGGRRLDGDSFASSGAISHYSGQRLLTGLLNYANASAFLYSNGTLGSSNTSFQTAGNTSNTDGTAPSLAIGSAVAVNRLEKWLGTQQELILYNTDQSANRTAIETNINAYYSIF